MRGVECNGGGGPCSLSVRGTLGLENFHVSAEFKFQCVVVYGGAPGHDRKWAHGVRNAVLGWKLIQAAIGMLDGRLDHFSRYALER